MVILIDIDYLASFEFDVSVLVIILFILPPQKGFLPIALNDPKGQAKTDYTRNKTCDIRRFVTFDALQADTLAAWPNRTMCVINLAVEDVKCVAGYSRR